ncbi:MAG: 50S ribosomal protein L11 methyltransferase [Rhodovibrionaceae bacterium]
MGASWRVGLRVPATALCYFETVLERLGGALVSDLPDEEGLVRLDLYLPGEPAAAALENCLAEAAEAGGIAPPEVDSQAVEDRDWVAESHAGLPPQRAGRFYLYGGHVTEKPPAATIPIRIDANAAFGTGRHETTKGCLLALGDLAKRPPPRPPYLDMGCGSGVLAIAMAKLWGRGKRDLVLAADNDPVAVRIAAENAKLNRVAAPVRALQSEGYASREIARAAPYGLVVANILAQPLCDMAGDLARVLAPGGVAVLSGLLIRQEREVLTAHLDNGMAISRRLRLGEWSTLQLVKR